MSASRGLWRIGPLALLLCWLIVAGLAASQERTSQDPPAQAVRAGEATDPDIEQDTPGLEAARERVETLRAELDRLSQRRASLVREFETADVELALRREQLAVLEHRAEILARQLDVQAGQVERLATSLSGAREALELRVRTLYRIGPLSYNRLLLSADSADDVLVAYQMVTYLTDRDRELVETVRQTLGDLHAARTSLEATSAQLDGLRVEARAAAVELEQQQEARRERVRAIDLEAEDTRIALAEAEDNASALERTLTRLAGTGEDALGERFAAARGELPWPAVGDVVGGFGRRRHPIYDTFTVSRGIEIGAPEGDPVSAVFPGRVAFADWYSGYGLLVILDHGGDYFTLYGHLREVTVRVGDRVEPGMLIGRVGETASLTGPNLYFEVREGTDALNPMQWLRRQR